MVFSQSAYDTSNNNPLASYGSNIFGPWFGNMFGSQGLFGSMPWMFPMFGGMGGLGASLGAQPGAGSSIPAANGAGNAGMLTQPAPNMMSTSTLTPAATPTFGSASSFPNLNSAPITGAGAALLSSFLHGGMRF